MAQGGHTEAVAARRFDQEGELGRHGGHACAAPSSISKSAPHPCFTAAERGALWAIQRAAHHPEMEALPPLLPEKLHAAAAHCCAQALRRTIMPSVKHLRRRLYSMGVVAPPLSRPPSSSAFAELILKLQASLPLRICETFSSKQRSVLPNTCSQRAAHA